MFSSITRQTKADFDTLKRVLDTHDAIRNLIFPEEKIKDSASLDPDKQQLSETLQNIKSGAPQRNDWLIYDHCAALPRLYAIFEQFVEDLATEYLALLPALYPSYNDLPLRVATQHRVGVAQILQKLGKDGPYKDIAERDVIEGLAKGQFGLDAYTLFPEAFLIDPQNYRAEIVNKIFQYLGFDDLWTGVEKHPLVEIFMTSRDSTETPRTLLKKLVDDRNIASHAGTIDIWSVAELKAVADFLEAITEALAALVSKAAILRRIHLKEVIKLGTVIHKYSNNIVGVEFEAGTLTVGDQVTVITKHGLSTARILSLAVETNLHETLIGYPGLQIGVKFDLELPMGAELTRYTQQLLLETVDNSSTEPITPDDYPIESELERSAETARPAEPSEQLTPLSEGPPSTART